MNENIFFFDTLSACHENLQTYVENIFDRRKTDKYIPENVAVFYSQRNISFLNIDESLIKSNQCKTHNLSLYVACNIQITQMIGVILRRLVYQCRDIFSSVFRYFLQVVVVGSTRNYVCRLGTLLCLHRSKYDR